MERVGEGGCLEGGGGPGKSRDSMELQVEMEHVGEGGCLEEGGMPGGRGKGCSVSKV